MRYICFREIGSEIRRVQERDSLRVLSFGVR